MFRACQVVEEEPSSDQPLPPPISANADRYWVWRGWTRKEDTMASVDVDGLDLVSVIEACRPWEQLKLPIDCSICKNEHPDGPLVRRAHWEYLHCQQCPDYFVCTPCAGTMSFIVDRIGTHMGHDFVRIRARPLESPLYDGSDLEQLVCFQASRSADSFFVYFPWFFHSFEHMHDMSMVFRHMFLEEMRKKTVDETLQVTERELEKILEMLEFPVDWFLRAYGGGDWKRFHSQLQPLIDSRIKTARTSQKICQLLSIAKGFIDNKVKLHGPGDVACPFQKEAALEYPIVLEWTAADFGLYMIALHTLTVLNDQIKLPLLTRAISDGIENGEANLVSANNAGNAGGKSHLSNQILPEAKRLWPMFELLFKDDPKFAELERIGIDFDNSDLALQLVFRSPKWKKFLVRDLSIREYLFEIRYLSISTKVGYLVQMRPIETREQIDILRKIRITRDFNRLETIYETLDMSCPEIAMRLQLIFLEQGHYLKAQACLEALQPSTKQQLDSVSYALSKAFVYLTSLYAGIFVDGGWEVALQNAKNLFGILLNADHTTSKNTSHAIAYLQIEIILHRIVLETYRDLHRPIPSSVVLTRLGTIRETLSICEPCPNIAETLWDVLNLELEIRKEVARAQYLEQEASFSSPSYLHIPGQAISLARDFLRSKVVRSTHLEIVTLRAYAELLLAELFKISGDTANAMSHVEAAGVLFEQSSCRSGLLHVRSFKAQMQTPPSFSEILSIYKQYREDNDLVHLRELRKVRVLVDSLETPEGKWLLYQRSDFRALAAEAGDNITVHRWSLRKYAGDFLVGAAVEPAEVVIAGEYAPHSVRLATLASFNLSQAYCTVGNYYEAALSAMLHLSICYAQNDSENTQRAILNVIKVFGDYLASEPKGVIEKLLDIPRLWNGWLDDFTLLRWAQGHPRCDEIDRFIDGALFLPLLAGRLGWQSISDHGRFAHLENVFAAHIAIALSIYTAMPEYLAAAELPKILLCLSGMAVFCNNYELSVRCCAEGLRIAHSEDHISINSLRFEAGKQMVSLGNRDPEHWLHVVAAGRSLLKSAAAGFSAHGELSGVMLHRGEANLCLFTSYVTEARARVKELNRELRESNQDIHQVEDFVGKFNAISKLAREANIPLFTNESLFDSIAERLTVSTPHSYHQNLAQLASKPLLLEMRQLILELCQITSASAYLMEDAQVAEGLWNMIQRFKGGVLGYSFGRVVPLDLLERIKRNEKAWDLYLQEKLLVQEGPLSIADNRLTTHQARMRKEPELEELLMRRQGRGVTKQELIDVVRKATVTSRTTIILFDWIRYRDRFILVGFNPQNGKFTEPHTITECDYEMAESWVAQHLAIDPERLSTTLGSYDCLDLLRPLVEPISHFAEPGAVLVFSPTQVLNAIPLHAIPYRDGEDAPVIEYHPIIYAPSNTVLRECVERSLAAPIERSLTASFFCRYPEDQALADAMISDLRESLEKKSVTSIYVSGTEVTHSKIASMIGEGDILHFHGHVAGDRLQKFLVLEQDPEASSSSTGAFHPTVHPSALHLLGASVSRESKKERHFAFQDITSASLQARIVFLMGCGSGVQEVTKADDALGLLNSFLAAGATTVMATLWPLENSDAAIWSREFYKVAFGEESMHEGGLLDVAAVVQSAVRETRACRRPRCARKSIDKRLKCHKVAPYHWAPFVGWGSWVAKI